MESHLGYASVTDAALEALVTPERGSARARAPGARGARARRWRAVTGWDRPKTRSPLFRAARSFVRMAGLEPARFYPLVPENGV